ncbi:alpha/beta fold hydrolase [Paenibacillus sp. GCM10027626]|uniref:alpha/beta hydrolase family protein n=1 Tax=Paenibacillus sp. GCM10027626 TaxID=3273411 RepID=UPI003639D98C
MKKKYSRMMKQLAAGSLLSMAVVQPLQAAAKAPATAAVQEAAASELVPLRELAEAIGANVKWDGANKQAIITRGTAQFIVKIGERTAKLNGSPYTMSSPAAAANQRMTLPLAALKEAFQAEISWSAAGGLTVSSEDVATAGAHFVYLLQHGKLAEARAMMNSALQQQMPEALLGQYWAGNTAAFGLPAALQSLTAENNNVHRNAKLGYVTEQSAPFGMIVRFDADGKIDDLFMPLVPDGAYQAPGYDKPELYKEEEIVIGEGALSLPATLTLPKNESSKPYPAVVLVHGSGPNDRDEAIGAYKTFRDIAVGLAGQNIAVLRYEKVTREHSLKTAMNPGFTVMEETVNDAVAAVQALAKDKRIDAKRIYVLGHSQGGMLVPRIIDNDKNGAVAGAVIMAGPSGPFEDILIEQNEDALAAAKQAGAATPEMEQQVAALKQQIALLKDPQYSLTNLPPGFAMANPAWWFDFRNYYGGEIAKSQTVPLFILQGDNDFQVKADQLNGWKKALSARQDVQYKLYPKLNHGFVTYDQPSTGQEYALPGNVPAEVIGDIAAWLKQHGQ